MTKNSISCKTTPMNQHFEMSVFNDNFTDIAQVEKVNHAGSQSSRNQNVLDNDNESEFNNTLDVCYETTSVHVQTLLNDNEINDEWDRYMHQDESEDCDVESLSETYSSESEIEDQDEIKNNEKCLAFELGMWAASFSISMVSISSLLSILRIFHPSILKDPRTILKTPRSSNVRAVEGGSYFHFGIVNSLQRRKPFNTFLQKYFIRSSCDFPAD